MTLQVSLNFTSPNRPTAPFIIFHNFSLVIRHFLTDSFRSLTKINQQLALIIASDARRRPEMKDD